MYPQRQLTDLDTRKSELRRRICLHRTECIDAATRLAVPLEWVDRVLAFLKRIKPVAMLAAVPIGALVARSESRSLRFLGSIARWAPIVLGAMGSS
jgi:hypothetical protein